MKRKSVLTVTVFLILATLVMMFTACSESKFVSITGIKDFSEIEEIEIVRNTVSDGVISGSEIKGFREEKDILEIFSLINNAKFDEDKRLETTDTEEPILAVRFYVKGQDGYLEYKWNKGFYRLGGYGKKTKGQYFRIVDSELLYRELMVIYFK